MTKSGYTKPHIVTSSICGLSLLSVVGLSTGCRSPQSYRTEADTVTGEILDESWQKALGRTEEGFTIEPASDSLRRKLLMDQNLPMRSKASAGSSDDDPIEQWPDISYFEDRATQDSQSQLDDSKSRIPTIALIEALEIAATNSRLYQSQKETVYQTALRLDLERDDFRHTWSGMVDSVLSSSLGSGSETNGVVNQSSLDVSKRFKNGSQFMGLLAVDLAKLLNGSRGSSMGLSVDTSLSIPLLRGSGKFVVTEPLKQAERDVVYAIYEFERFKRTFAVQIASDYLTVLQQLDRVDNAVENYERVVSSTRRARRLADAGRLPEIQVDQSVQDELRARNSWISAVQGAEQVLDRFKITLGLPPDAKIQLDPAEFEVLLQSKRYERYLEHSPNDTLTDVPPADAPVVLVPPSIEDAGPMELHESDAILIALVNRLDLRVAVGEIVDAQRSVAIAADNLRADITLLGSASLGESRSLSSADLDDAQVRTDRGFYSLLLGIDLPFERTAERNSYRNSLISYEQTIRRLQDIEDSVKFDIRSDLRSLLESRESIKIQAESVRVAQRRVDSTNLFLQAGRAEIRDLLESQNALNSAQDALTNAVVSYRIGELELQRDLGVLEVDSNGLWTEFNPQEYDIEETKSLIQFLSEQGDSVADRTTRDEG
ncbi:MAG: TolC family protein [Phycisphaerales bacterium]|nr:TolC family protein [Phycisphaerales bacterium]